VTTKIRSCRECGATIIKTETETRLYAEMGRKLCGTCANIMLGSEPEGCWTEVKP